MCPYRTVTLSIYRSLAPDPESNKTLDIYVDLQFLVIGDLW